MFLNFTKLICRSLQLTFLSAAVAGFSFAASICFGDSAATQPADSTSATADQTASSPSDSSNPTPQVGRFVFVQNEPSLFEYDFPTLSFQDASLFDVLSKLSQTSDTNLVASWGALAHAGVDPKAKLTFELPAQDYRHELVDVLRKYAPHVFMVISADENVILINTRDSDDQQLVVRDYWVQDLTTNLPQIIQAGKNLQAIDAAPATQPAAKPPLETNILELISSTVRPEIWVNHGGKATITQVGDRVIVTAPLNVQAILDGPKTYNPDAVPLYIMY